VTVSCGRIAAWSFVVFGLAATDRLASGQPPTARMLALILALFVGMKAVVLVESSCRGVRLAPLRCLAFVTLWPGMRPEVFARRAGRRDGASTLAAQGVGHAAWGIALVLGARVVFECSGSRALATVLLLPGLSLIVHFGLFDVLAGIGRLAGARTASLFREPWAARSLGEFWSERWNVAFSEMTAVAIYRPIASRLGRDAALVASFLFSGLAHEAAISLPVRAGYGLPTAYFLLHALLVLREERHGPAPTALRLAALVLPLPLLFHPPFLRAIAWPLLG
jgi:alginate O-acetyltransferase complex protein AlgI